MKLTVVSPTRSATGIERLDWGDLMRRAQDGDREAYRVLLNAITPYVRSIAGRCFNDSRDIEDAVQDVLLTVHAIRRTYDPERPFGPWLATIARRRIIDHLRKQARNKTREIALSTEHETFSDHSANSENRAVDDQALSSALNKLPQDHQRVLRMLKLEQRSLKEVAAATGHSITSLKVMTHRAVKKLRAVLTEERKP